MVMKYSIQGTNQVQVPVLLVVSPNREGKVIILSTFAPETFVSRAVPSRVSSLILHTHAKSGVFYGLLSFLPLSASSSIYNTNNIHRVSPELIGSHSCVRMAFTAERPPVQGQ